VGWGLNKFTIISTYGVEFHAYEECQQCDNLNVFKEKTKKKTNAQICCCLHHCSF
jgi:hypothetical protein